MKNLIKYAGLTIMVLITMIVVMDINGVTTRQTEIEEGLTSSMYSTLKGTNVYKMYDISDEEMSAELLRNLAENVNTDSTLDVYVNGASNKGVLDVTLQASYNHLNGQADDIFARKTLIYDSVPVE